ncbi:transposase [Streptomyces nigrescens]
MSRIPGIGTTLGAYLLAEIGDRPVERFGTGHSLAAYARVGPVTWASGQTVRVAFRRASSTHLRSTLHAVAFSMVGHSPGAQAYYRRRRAAGDAHATALRKLGRKILLCLHHCMASGVSYDDAVAFGYDPAAADAPTLQREKPLDDMEIARPWHARCPRRHRHCHGTGLRGEYADDLPPCTRPAPPTVTGPRRTLGPRAEAFIVRR